MSIYLFYTYSEYMHLCNRDLWSLSCKSIQSRSYIDCNLAAGLLKMFIKHILWFWNAAFVVLLLRGYCMEYIAWIWFFFSAPLCLYYLFLFSICCSTTFYQYFAAKCSCKSYRSLIPMVTWQKQLAIWRYNFSYYEWIKWCIFHHISDLF